MERSEKGRKGDRKRKIKRVRGTGRAGREAERERERETRCRDMWEPLDPIVHTDGFEPL